MGELLDNKVFILIGGNTSEMIVIAVSCFALVSFGIIIFGNNTQNTRLLKFIAAIKKRTE